MKYILSQNEYDVLSSKPDRVREALTAVIQDLCTKVCDNMPIKFWGNEEAKTWGCIKTSSNEWYCDECPVQEQCPQEYKHWSK